MPEPLGQQTFRLRGGQLPKLEPWREIGATGEPAFANAWVNFGSTNETAAYYKDGVGVVRLKGVIKSGTVGSNCFTLPTGYRPAADIIFAVASFDGTNWIVGVLKVLSGGGVRPMAGSNNTFSLSGVSFRAL